MPDEFDRFLASSLAPGERLPDRRFVAGVQTRILIEERLAGERRALVASLVTQLIALLAVTAAAWWLGRAEPVAHLFADAQWLGVLILLVAFSFVVAIFSSMGRPRIRRLRIG